VCEPFKMIQHLTRNQLDEEKYNNCISKAVNMRIYAYSWYLDIVCDNWDAIILDDYQAVMPLPKRKKYGIHYIYQAPWTQQLGVFSDVVVESSLVDQFIKSIPRKFKLIDVFLNSENTIDSSQIQLRDNYILSLNRPYETIRKQFSKGRKSSVKQAEKFDLTIVDNYDHDVIIELFKKNKGLELHKKGLEYDILSKLIKYSLAFNFAKSYAVINDRNELIGGAFFLIDANRITYLFSSINDKGRAKHAMSFLINHIIQTHAKSNYIFDFEGSVVKELASFFKSFGAEKETYFHFKKYII